MKNLFLGWLPFAILITVLSGMVYGTVQQNYRTSANDPQIQIAEDLSSALSAGQQNINLPTAKADMERSLGAFIIVVDDNGALLYSSALLDGGTPVPPAGVMVYAKANGQNRITWQPKTGVRAAIVVNSFTDSKSGRSGSVVVGRSLREVEKRIKNLGLEVGTAWFTAMIGSFIALWFMRKKVV